MRFITTPIKIAVHMKQNNPVFGEAVTHVSLEDESGGAFFVLSQEGQEIRVDIDELEMILKAAKQMKSTYKEYDNVI